MYFSGENLIMEQAEGAIIKNQLYLLGSNLVPEYLLPNPQGEFGEIESWSLMKIDRERYYEIAGSMRKMIENDFSYRFFLKKRTEELLKEFDENTSEFERRMANDDLDPDWLKASLEQYGKMLSLLEYNGMIPYHWFGKQIDEVRQDNKLGIEDFSHTKDYSHRVYLYKYKLLFLKKWFDCVDFSQEAAVDQFMDEYNYLSDKGDPLLWDFAEKRQELCEEFEQMRKQFGSIEAIDAEILFIEKRRKELQWKYYDNLRLINEGCNKKNYSPEKTANLLHALTVISYTCNEEEMRHFYQDRYWVLLNKLVKKLELPLAYVSMESLVEAVRQNY